MRISMRFCCQRGHDWLQSLAILDTGIALQDLGRIWLCCRGCGGALLPVWPAAA